MNISIKIIGEGNPDDIALELKKLTDTIRKRDYHFDLQKDGFYLYETPNLYLDIMKAED